MILLPLSVSSLLSSSRLFSVCCLSTVHASVPHFSSFLLRRHTDDDNDDGRASSGMLGEGEGEERQGEETDEEGSSWEYAGMR
jgi:hypothetical protein